MNRVFVVLALMGMGFPVLAAPAGRAGKALSPDELKAMTLEQMLSSGEKMVAEMKGKSEEILDAYAEAQKQKDFVRINCIGDSLTTMKGLMRLSEENLMSLKMKVIARDRSGAEHEFVKLSIASGKLGDMYAQAKGCGGPTGETVFEGAPVVERRFDKDLPTDDPRAGLDVMAIVLSPPPSASPYY